MRRHIGKMTAFAILSLILFGSIAVADDDMPPAWRGEPGSFTAEWDIWTGFPVGNIAAPDTYSSVPFPGSDPLGPPEAERHGDIGFFSLFPRTEVVSLREDNAIIFKLDNFNNDNPEKIIHLQITFLPTGELGWPSAFDVWEFWGAGGNVFTVSAASALLWASEPKIGGWITAVYEIHMQPNPDVETIGLKFDTYPAPVDQVVIDTICLPEELQADFGDAPETDTLFYPTRKSNMGAYHLLPMGTLPVYYLGATVDAEPDGQPTPEADGDDLNNDDEDGVFLGPAWTAGANANITVNASMPGYLNAWADWNMNGFWEPADQIFTDIPVTAGNNILSIPVPAGIVGDTYVRFRFTSYAANLPPDGRAEDGEVEDYKVTIVLPELYDLGDAPDSTNNFGQPMPMDAYPGIQANFATVYQDPVGSIPVGPLHRNISAVWLGQVISGEIEADSGYDTDGVNNINPLFNVADQEIGSDDGLITPVLRMPHCGWSRLEYSVTVNLPVPLLYVNIWFDFNRDGDWDDALVCPQGVVPEWAVQNQLLISLPSGVHRITTPAFAAWHPAPWEDAPENLWMRITLAETPWTTGSAAGLVGNGGSGPVGGYQYGETEDYLVVPDTTCALCGDLNCDRVVNLLDFALMAQNWLGSCP